MKKLLKCRKSLFQPMAMSHRSRFISAKKVNGHVIWWQGRRMEMSSINHFRNQRGLTLIEVLIALAIVAIALTAVIKATSEDIRATNYLRNKTMAMCAGQYVMNAVQTGVIKLETSNERKEMEILNKKLYWQANQEET